MKDLNETICSNLTTLFRMDISPDSYISELRLDSLDLLEACQCIEECFGCGSLSDEVMNKMSQEDTIKDMIQLAADYFVEQKQG